MNQSPPDTLEVYVSFEANRLASLYIIDAYELLIPMIREQQSAATESTSPVPRQKPTREKKAV
jgi:hypothetical protein